MGSSVILQLARKYGAVIFFPTVAVGSIYADWSHTRAWKRQQLLAAQSAALKSQS
ncbi:uncharacterized protein LOC115768264 [Drosophila novamexicana]|uniref:uncharacterized protein n=1 Tax=Drosophila virilis TaxID=7244 RepID=UPI0011E5C457|nr:uncharacterized protein LOC6633747 [Drosophila virilis]XP_015025651.2 uncharacterized protein LOC6633747 [Drosophila virilis]XP_030568654.1 uncharacterized protein LOC115768264 [Drosophila novamexicana]XP_030568655.1 uncharacterized protein LOC115768264 [Drosophila novamexicana]XP_030568656.1 uncharacterized protein LOC115768264 [Drosophila novamexicana]